MSTRTVIALSLRTRMRNAASAWLSLSILPHPGRASPQERQARLSQCERWVRHSALTRVRCLRIRVGRLRSGAVKARLNDTQTAVLRWVADGQPDGAATNPQRLTARALSNRRLVKIKGRGPRWRAELTDAGRHHLESTGSIRSDISGPSPGQSRKGRRSPNP